MHVMFVHPNVYSQFTPLAWHLSTERRWQCTVVSAMDASHLKLPFNHVGYPVAGRPPSRDPPAISTLEQKLEHLKSVYVTLKRIPAIRPDVVVGHLSFGTVLYLRNLYRDARFVGYFEWLPGRFWTDDLVRRPEYPPSDGVRLGMATYHALTTVQLHAVDRAYSPTAFQRASAPPELQYKIETAFDGVDTETFRPREVPRPARIGGVELPPGVKVVTYVSPGLESIRGFDVFMQVVKRVCRARDDVVFLVAGEGRTVYGHETDHLQGRSFKDHVLASDEFPLDRVRFLGRIPLEELARLFNLADAHVYLTVPFTLSWSLVQAMASGCVVVGSATAPVEEVIDDGVHGLLAEFHDADGLARRVLAVLDDPAARGRLGAAASARVAQRYSREVCFERLARLFDADAAGGSAGR